MKEKLFLFILTCVFFLNTQFNFFHLIPQQFFEYSKTETSEELIIGKLLNSEQGSILEDGGFTGYFYSKGGSSDSIEKKWSFEKYTNSEIPKKTFYDPYKSQIGGQAILYSIFDKIFNLDNAINLILFRAFNSLLLSILLSLFVVWIKRKFGSTVALICFVFILPNYWIFLFGKSTWWCNWVYFLPFIYGLFFFEENRKPNFRKYVFISSVLVFIKFWFTGFEFITTFLIASSIPYIYYVFENTISFYYKFIVRHFLIVIFPFICTILFQLYQFKLLTGNFKDGIDHLTDAYTRRSSNHYSYEGTYSYLNTLKKFHLDIITQYLGNSFISSDILGFKFPFAILIGIGTISSYILYKKNIERRLVAITWFSIAAPFSWFILFKQHAYIHKHIDFFIWYCPFLLLLILLISLTLNFFLKKLK